MRRLRGPLIALIYVSGPIAAFSYAKMALLALESWPGWVFAIVAIAHVIAWLGLASLIDIRREQRQNQQGGLPCAPDPQ